MVKVKAMQYKKALKQRFIRAKACNFSYVKCPQSSLHVWKGMTLMCLLQGIRRRLNPNAVTITNIYSHDTQLFQISPTGYVHKDYVGSLFKICRGHNPSREINSSQKCDYFASWNSPTKYLKYMKQQIHSILGMHGKVWQQHSQ